MSEVILFLLAVAGSALVLTQSAITAPLRDGLDRLAARSEVDGARRGAFYRGAAKLISCPMCCGFWLGLGWAHTLGIQGVWSVACAFAGSVSAAIVVAAWVALGEAQAALALWRYFATPPEDR